MAPQKIIIDTDPGCDDILAILLALSASEEELQVLMLSLTFGNIDIENVLRNTVAMFHVIELEQQWRVKNGLPPGFRSLEKFKPIVAVGADAPLEDEKLMGDYFHGFDGLADVSTSHPHFTPAESWKHLFEAPPTLTDSQAPVDLPCNFTPSSKPAYQEILRLLRENEPDTVTIVAIGPLTNLALAAAEDVETFLRVKEVVLMGGTIDTEGNVTPAAEFNHFACAWSAARIYALTSPNPSSTLPPPRTDTQQKQKELYPGSITSRSRPLNLTIFPLDITMRHLLSEKTFTSITTPLITAGSPLASWCSVFVLRCFKKMQELHVPDNERLRIQDVDLSMHDPLCVYYLLTRHLGGWSVVEGRDIRVEVSGQWTRGMCVVDRRTRRMEEDVAMGVVVGDVGVWLHRGYGNRVRQVVRSREGDEEGFGGVMLGRIFG